MFESDKLRAQFPFFSNTQCVYLDNGATTQKPQCVIDALSDFYINHNVNVHRGVSRFASNTTKSYEQVREKLAQYCHVKAEQIIWTKGATEAINLIASSIDKHIDENDIIVVSALEHHANLIPWQELCKRTGAKLNILPVDKNGELNLAASLKIIKQTKPKLVACTHASNTLGSILPIEKIIACAQSVNALTLIDGAQAMQHLKPNIAELDRKSVV